MRFLSEDKFIFTINRSLVEISIVGNFMVVVRRVVYFLENLFLLQTIKFMSYRTPIFVNPYGKNEALCLYNISTKFKLNPMVNKIEIKFLLK